MEKKLQEPANYIQNFYHDNSKLVLLLRKGVYPYE